jgi:hypothetical protein
MNTKAAIIISCKMASHSAKQREGKKKINAKEEMHAVIHISIKITLL